MNTEKNLKLLNEIKQKIKSTDTIKKMFKDEGLSLDIIDLVPMCFSDLEVSARTQHGIIYFNKDLLKKPEEIDHYMVHELTHVLQQCFSDGPTQGSNDSNYLDNPYEQEGFQNQTKFLSETEGEEVAEEYIDKVLEHHDVSKKEIKDKKDALLSTASMKKRKDKLTEFLTSQLPEKQKDDTIRLHDASKITLNMLRRMEEDPEYKKRILQLMKEDKEQELLDNPELFNKIKKERQEKIDQVETNRKGVAEMLRVLNELSEKNKR